MANLKTLSVVMAAMFGLAGCSINPKPIEPEARMANILQDQAEMYGKQEPITAPLSFYDVLARALKYNFDHRLTMMEAVLQDTQLSVATMNMLPKLAINAGYIARDKQLGSSSVDYFNQNSSSQLSRYATSQDKERGVADLSFTWNLLDFGVSYYQAKQQADRILIAQERRRKVVNNLIKEVLEAYWMAHLADRLLPKITPVLEQARSAYQLSQKIEGDNLQPLLDVLEYQRSLLRIIDQLEKLKADMMIAKPKLMGLINAPMHSKMELEDLPNEEHVPPQLKVSTIELENLGLFYRPELREEIYQERISRDEVWKEILKTMPGLTIPLSVNWDSNSFLVHDLWLEAGARTTFNLVNLLAAPKIWKSAETQIQVVNTRRKALSVATLVQINVGHQQYLKALDNYKMASELNKIDENIFKLMRNNQSQGAGSELEVIHAATSSIASQLEKEQSLAEIYAALGNIYASIGLDPLASKVEELTVRDISVQLKNTLGHWIHGELPKIPVKAAAAESVNKSAVAEKKPG